ncbi:MAG: glycosyltransferase [Gammaproteobacteria bacterium]|nr:MAG: glycosyltransferase [Gammaproteobacteria bacterium]RLA62148.1 MAG: glycosyltransferase [Gammaproteobacteria bacterium]
MTLDTDQVLPQRIAFLMDNLKGGGAERVMLSLASGFSALGYDVDLLVCEMHGELCDSIPDGVNLVVLAPTRLLAGLWTALSSHRGVAAKILSYIVSNRKVPRSFRFIRAISDHLLLQRPAVILSTLSKANINAVLAVALAGVETRVCLGIQNSMSTRYKQGVKLDQGQFHNMIPLLRHCYARADSVIASSRGVAEDATAFLGLNPKRLHVVYNPVHVTELAKVMEEPLRHPWFTPGAAPVLLSIGRFVDQKNFPLLVEAFAKVRQRIDARLVIIGGDESSSDQMVHRLRLQALAADLGVGDDIDLPGYQPNPYPYLKAAGVFVLSSDYEGFGNVLIEALLAGCPVVSTDCPSGPSEILHDGQYGILVPVDDSDSLADAILEALAIAPQRDKLRQRGREFSLERAVDGYHRQFFGEPPVRAATTSVDSHPLNAVRRPSKVAARRCPSA